MHNQFESSEQIAQDRTYLRLLSNLPGMVYRCRNDADWTMEFVSEGCFRLLGFPPEDLLSSHYTYASLVHPDDLTNLQQTVKEALSLSRQFDIEYRVCLPDGRIKWVWERGSGVYDDNGTTIAIDGFISDITTRKKAEQLVQRQTAFRALILELSASFINLPLTNIDSAINSALARIGAFFAADRAYVFTYDFAREVTHNTHEWCTPGVTAQLSNLQRIPLAEIKTVTQPHRRGEAVVIPDVALLDDKRFKAHLQQQDIQSVLAVPLMTAKECQGFVGLDAVRRKINFGPDERDLLSWFASLLVNLFDRKQIEDRMNFFKLAVDQAADGIAVADMDGYILFTNEAWAEAHEQPKEALTGHHLSLFHTEQQMQRDVLPFIEKLLEDQTAYSGEVGHVRSDGTEFTAFMTTTILRNDAGEPLGMFANMRDISMQKAQERELRLAASVFEFAKEGICITDPEGSIIDVNHSFSEITGYSRDEVIGQNPRILSSGRQDRMFYQNLWKTVESKEYWAGEIWNRRKSGEIYPELLTITAVKNHTGATQNYIGLFSDITSLKDYQKKLERIAFYDSLTGLPNRVLLADRLNQAIFKSLRQQTTLAVAYLDLDGFKEINDRFDHQTGDLVLASISGRIKSILREGDTLARMGGDEFVLVMPDLCAHEDAITVVERILAVVNHHVTVDQIQMQVTVSIGVSFYPLDDNNLAPDQFIRQADQAMYEAKQSGKNRYKLFDIAQDRAVRGRSKDLQRLQQAIEQGELIIYYQPKVNMKTGEVIGLEALVRWQHPEKGLLRPDKFLPITHNHPLGVILDDWVMEAVFRQIVEWRSMNLCLPVSVNVCSMQLESANFTEKLSALFATYPLVQSGDIELEILETSALDDIKHVSAVIQSCEAMGISFSLDDFGTGYSSLAYLKKLPAKWLKIDRDFIRDMLDDPDDLAILDGVIGLAKAFRRQVIAEGVETFLHGKMLLHMGCEYAQGYAIAPPMPANELPGWLENWRQPCEWLDVKPLDTATLPILFTLVDHRAWRHGLQDYLEQKSSLPPEMDDRKCRFYQWWIAVVDKRTIPRETLDQLLSIHDDIHVRGRAMIASQSPKQRLQDVAAWHSLMEVSETLCAELHRLLDA